MARHNLIKWPRAEDGTIGGWTGYSGGAAPSSSTDYAKIGTRSFKITKTTTASPGMAYPTSDPIPYTTGDWHFFSIRALVGSATAQNYVLGVEYLNASKAVVTSKTLSVTGNTLSTGWIRSAVTNIRSTDTSVVWLRPYVYMVDQGSTTTPVGTSLYVDGVMMEKEPNVSPGNYPDSTNSHQLDLFFDGSATPWVGWTNSWDGTPYASTSTSVWSAPAPITWNTDQAVNLFPNPGMSGLNGTVPAGLTTDPLEGSLTQATVGGSAVAQVDFGTGGYSVPTFFFAPYASYRGSNKGNFEDFRLPTGDYVLSFDAISGATAPSYDPTYGWPALEAYTAEDPSGASWYYNFKNFTAANQRLRFHIPLRAVADALNYSEYYLSWTVLSGSSPLYVDNVAVTPSNRLFSGQGLSASTLTGTTTGMVPGKRYLITAQCSDQTATATVKVDGVAVLSFNGSDGTNQSVDLPQGQAVDLVLGSATDTWTVLIHDGPADYFDGDTAAANGYTYAYAGTSDRPYSVRTYAPLPVSNALFTADRNQGGIPAHATTIAVHRTTSFIAAVDFRYLPPTTG